MPKKKQPEIEEEEYDYPDEEEQAKPRRRASSIPEDMEEISPEKEIEDHFQDIEKRFRKIEHAMSVVQKWVKRNAEAVDRIEENFKVLLEK